MSEGTTTQPRFDFEELLRRVRPNLVRYAASLLRAERITNWDADDVVQLAVLCAWTRGNAVADPCAYMRETIRKEIRRHAARERKKPSPVPMDTPTVEKATPPPGDSIEEGIEVRRALRDRHPDNPERVEAIWRVLGLGEPARIVAGSISRPPNTVASWVRRDRLFLSSALIGLVTEWAALLLYSVMQSAQKASSGTWGAPDPTAGPADSPGPTGAGPSDSPDPGGTTTAGTGPIKPAGGSGSASGGFWQHPVLIAGITIVLVLLAGLLLRWVIPRARALLHRQLRRLWQLAVRAAERTRVARLWPFRRQRSSSEPIPPDPTNSTTADPSVWAPPRG
ncbi:DNA-directed RNA polymerase specialized sigma24 family protein [Streptacidiphilus sp. MAP12-16]